MVTEKSTSRSATPSESSNDRRFNIVIFGIPECDPGTSRFTRMAQDSTNVVSALQNIDSNLSESVVRDCFRLGKYKQNSSRPRSILAKLCRTIDVVNILSKKDVYPNEITIKPDMSPEERSIEAELLKQRWSLIQYGIDRKFIKIKKASIYVSNKFYGSIKKLKFIMATERADVTDQSAVAPINNVSILAPVVEIERSDVTDQSAIAQLIMSLTQLM